ncbi:MAG TPA: GNAT family N-acetyltransferase [Candidatus Binatia bacterium]|nr:GNAT family N-acetyltransferase [Candidatus Binatia bacterium]
MTEKPDTVDRTSETVEIVDRAESRRYEALLDGQLAGFVDYGRVGGRIVAVHTEVFPEFGGRGIASALVRRVLADARAEGARVTPRCPFFQAHFERHPEDRDLLPPTWRLGAARAKDGEHEPSKKRRAR